MSSPPGLAATPSSTVRPAEKGDERNGIRRRLVVAVATLTSMSFKDARRVVDSRIALNETPDQIEAYLHATYRIDPTGVTAVRNVTRGLR